MVRSYCRFSLCAASLCLASCGGGGGTSVGIVTPPPPPPPPSSFPLVQSASLATADSQLDYTTNLNGSFTVNKLNTSGQPSGLSINYDSATGNYKVDDGTNSAIFTGASRSSAGYIDSYSSQSGTVTDKLNLYSNVRSGASQTGAPVALTYLSYGSWSHTDSQNADTRVTDFIFGYPTASTDMPRSGTATYQTSVSGQELFNGYSPRLGQYDVGGSATLSANFGTGAIDTTLQLQRTLDNGVIGTFTGSGTINSNQFTGTFSATDPNFQSGSFSGGFFGPQAAEAGYTFSIRQHNPDPYGGAALPNLLDAWIVGTVVGKKSGN